MIKDLKMKRKVFKNIIVFDGFEFFKGSIEVVGKVIGRVEKNGADIAVQKYYLLQLKMLF